MPREGAPGEVFRGATAPELLALVATLLVLAVPSLGQDVEEPAEEVAYCLMCHEDSGEEIALEDGSSMSISFEAGPFLASAHGQELFCTDCHAGYDDMDDHPSDRTFESRRSYVLASRDVCRECHFDTDSRHRESIHAAMLDAGLDEAPVCTDCHGAHAIADPGQKAEMLSRSCGSCHVDVVRAYQGSVHGRSLLEHPSDDVPACVDCHTAHSISEAGSPGFHVGSSEICLGCHSDPERMAPYDIPVDVGTTFLADFHGATAALIDRENVEERQLVVTCVDCHGVHDMASPALLPPGEMQARVREVCARCHEDGAEDFSEAWLSHYRPTLENAPLVYLVQLFYDIFIPFVVLGTSLQVLLHVSRRVLRG